MAHISNVIYFKEEYLQVFESQEVVDQFHENPVPGRNEIIAEYYKNLSENLRSKNNDETGKTLHLLDVGCGNGRLTKQFANHFGKVTAIDISENMIAKAKHQFTDEKITFKIGTSSELPVDDDSVDVISCIFSAQHFPDMDKFVSECNRVLRVEGVVGMWMELLDHVTLEPRQKSNKIEESKKICSEIYDECLKHTAAVGDCEWFVFDRYKTLFKNISGIKKSLHDESGFDMVATLEEYLTSAMAIPVFRDVEYAWKKWEKKLKQLYNLKDTGNKDIKLRITHAPCVIILTKTQ